VARGAIAGRFRVIPRFLAAAITASRSYTQIEILIERYLSEERRKFSKLKCTVYLK
jgi:hypothetical protein